MDESAKEIYQMNIVSINVNYFLFLNIIFDVLFYK